MEKQFKALFLCTGNSARSILAEYLMRKTGGNRLDVFSAGSHPKECVHPLAIRILKEVYKIDASQARSKPIDEVKTVRFDFVITLCDNAREKCPVFPGQLCPAISKCPCCHVSTAHNTSRMPQPRILAHATDRIFAFRFDPLFVVSAFQFSNGAGGCSNVSFQNSNSACFSF